jgi:hypothetical protein
VTEQALAAHDAALATADERRRASEDEQLRIRLDALVLAAQQSFRADDRGPFDDGLKWRRLMNFARAELLAYIETLRAK